MTITSSSCWSSPGMYIATNGGVQELVFCQDVTLGHWRVAVTSYCNKTGHFLAATGHHEICSTLRRVYMHYYFSCYMHRCMCMECMLQYGLIHSCMPESN